MYGTQISELKDAMKNILSQLYVEDLFSIVQFTERVYLWDLNLRYYDVLPWDPQYGNLANQLKVHKFKQIYSTI